MPARENYVRQLLADLDTLHSLILRYARGETAVRQARDRIEGEVQVKLAFWKAIMRHTRNDD